MPAPTVAGRHDVEIARIQERKDARLIDARYGLFRTMVRGAIVIFTCFFGYLAMRVVAGTSTSFTAVLKASLELSVDRWAAYILAALGGAGWYGERTLRKKSLSKRDAYIKELEEKIDPKRSSSNLLPTGNPRKEDTDAP